MDRNSFLYRHNGPRQHEVREMLETIGVDSVEQLMHETIPDSIRQQGELKLDPVMSELQYADHIAELGAKNRVFKNYIGLGYHDTILPAVIQRNIFENPGWYTAYTPYQAEIAQGRLEMLLNFQTMISELTGMQLANASLLDEATAAAEAMIMLFNIRSRAQSKAGVVKFFVDESCLPQNLALLNTRAVPFGIEIITGKPHLFDFSSEFFGCILQYPNADGQVENYSEFCEKAAEADIKVAVAADVMSLVLLTPPGEWGADVVVGTTQRFGIPLGYGGPHAAYFATKEDYKRHIPGRIIGKTKDRNGNEALRMALQTREQHIKRDKATSNICTAQVLLAVMAGAYGAYHGPVGLQRIASRIHNLASTLDAGLNEMGIIQENTNYFDTLKVTGVDSEKVKAAAEAKQMNFRIEEDFVGLSISETTSLEDINTILSVFAEATEKAAVEVELVESHLDQKLLRTSDFMTFEVFKKYHSETEMMRYLKRLERKDLSLNHSMIALGSCTMKLNAGSEMLPLSKGEWNTIHPFAPLDQAAGYQELLAQMEVDLAEITGFDATSLQPNSGAQGEYAGLMTIKAYHENNGDHHRNIALIPSSAHGTNPASAVMAGMKVVVVKSTEAGNIDVDDLRQKAEKYSANLASLLVTYPSTHGVFESSIKEVTQIIHDNGGQVYMDGANMNAQVGLTSPGLIGADVCHLNLHKTFAIPHGGGGPGMGPICVKAHLAPFLPTNPIVKTGGDKADYAISAAPYGSALVLLISYAYIKMLGSEGLLEVTKTAILNANYMKARLEKEYPILYSGETGRCAHEMILDCRGFKKEAKIEVVDIAKRLMDYGFHAPTVSFPVAGTLMVEPTESENKAELDRFCDAMIAIKAEIDTVANGGDVENNPLKNAPHTLDMLTSDTWSLPYPRQEAAYPADFVAENKFWPSVRRVDDAYGDRNLVCTCTPIEAYAEA